MGDSPEDGEFRIDRTKFSVVSLTDADDSVAYWLSRPVEERLRAQEFLRRVWFGEAACGRLQKVLEVESRGLSEGAAFSPKTPYIDL